MVASSISAFIGGRPSDPYQELPNDALMFICASGPSFLHIRDSTNGAFVKRGVGSVTDFFPVIACVRATLKLRGTGMSLVSLSRHPPPSQCLILPSGQTLVHSSDHLSCPNQEPAWHSNTDGRLEVASYNAMMLSMRMRVITSIVIGNGVACV